MLLSDRAWPLMVALHGGIRRDAFK